MGDVADQTRPEFTKVAAGGFLDFGSVAATAAILSIPHLPCSRLRDWGDNWRAALPLYPSSSAFRPLVGGLAVREPGEQ